MAPFNFGSYRLGEQLETSHGVIFETFLNPSKVPIGPHNVYISNYVGYNRVNTIVGTPSAGATDDGRYSYRIVFTNPQRYAGVLRLWGATTLTEFYSPDDSLLHQAVGSDFHGFQADTSQTSGWVKKIVVTHDGDTQVGYTDDLFFGTEGPPDKECNFIVLPTKNGGALAGCL